MNILIIYSHPNEASLNHTILEIFDHHISKKNNVKILDLYRDDFNPILYFDEHHRRRDLKNEPFTQKYRDDLAWANHLVFIYPIWWSGMPAILKGYIDRVFSKGFAYEYKGVIPVALLSGKTATIITTHDTPNIYVKLFQQDYGKVLKKQILKMCGIKTIKAISIPFLRGADENKRSKFLTKISNHAESL